MIAAVLFDLDGVVRRWDPAITSRAEEEHGLPVGAVLEAAFASDLLPAAVTGALTDEAWRAAVADALAARYGPAGRRAVRDWSEPHGEVVAEVLALVRAERRRRRVGLLSNATTRLEADLAALGLDAEFDIVVNTARVGHAKPDPAVFTWACDALGASAEQCAFVDDSPGHVEAARRLGLTGHVFRTPEALAEFLDVL